MKEHTRNFLARMGYLEAAMAGSIYGLSLDFGDAPIHEGVMGALFSSYVMMPVVAAAAIAGALGLYSKWKDENRAMGSFRV